MKQRGEGGGGLQAFVTNEHEKLGLHPVLPGIIGGGCGPLATVGQSGTSTI